MTFVSNEPLLLLCEADLVTAGHISGGNFPHSLSSGTNSSTGCCTRAQNMGKHQKLFLPSVSWQLLGSSAQQKGSGAGSLPLV